MRIIILTIFLFFAHVSNSMTDEVEVAGYVSCGNYLSYLNGENAIALAMHASWAEGFLSGFNAGVVSYKGPTRKVPDRESVKFAIKKYCSNNPLKSTLDAVINEILIKLPIN